MSEQEYEPISITLPKDILKLLDEVCEKQHLSRSECLRRGFGYFLKNIPKPPEPEAGIYVDASGCQTFVGLLSDEGKAKVSRGEWRCVKEF